MKKGALSPPTLFLSIDLLMQKAAESTKVRDLVIEVYPKLLDWFGWYERKTLGMSIPCTFSFRERTSTLAEQSCLDDYPRGVVVHDRAEVHLDLQSQMIEFAMTMQQLSLALKGPNSPQSEQFKSKAECYTRKLKDYLLNENMGYYADYVSL